MCPVTSTTADARSNPVVTSSRRSRARAMSNDLGRVLDDEPIAGVTSLSWYRDVHASDDATTMRALCTAWDGRARAYDVRRRGLGAITRVASVDCGAPVLCGTFVGSADACVVGCADGGVRWIDLKSGARATVGAHEGGARTVMWDEKRRVVISGGWDRRVKTWDLGVGIEGRCVSSTEVVGKCYAGDARDGRCVLATSDGQILAYDVEDLIRGGRPRANRRSSVRFQTRAIALNASADWFVNATVEGRVAVEYVDDEENEKRRFAFKCHRGKNEDGSAGEVIYPVHSVSFHPLGTFATGGGDGYVSYWDAEARKRLFMTPRYPTSVSALAFSPCGTMLAVASSFVHEEQENATPVDRLYLRVVNAEEVTPKSASAR